MKTPSKRLLLLGGGHSDIPLIRAAKALGFHVTTSGNRPDDLGHKYADAYQGMDYSNVDETVALVRALAPGALVSCCNDFSAISCAFAARALGLAGHDSPETVLLIHLKDRWRAFASNHGIPSPAAIACESRQAAMDAIAAMALPVLIKPVDLTGGKGIGRVNVPGEATVMVERAFMASRASRVVVEEFVTGSRHGFTVFLCDKKAVFSMGDDEHYHLSPYLVSAASAPGNIPPAVRQQLVDFSEKVADILNLVDGIFHVQYIERQGQAIIIEVCRRAPGDLYIDLVRHVTGADYPSWIVQASAGLDCAHLRANPTGRFVTRHCLMAKEPGTFHRFDFDESVAPRIIDQLLWSAPGERIHDPTTQKFGIVFVAHASQEHMNQEAPRLTDLLRVETLAISGPTESGEPSSC